ncbi:helix-turn-helix domain-containing protein [Thiothrix subterranea]|uniref:helix-turn-helix domain-containing protein n=1 Tax=Thiothrix subterranea TaxID=2735563 RepID=UPI00280B2481|nr:helix-turn-helix domain-containing protein [Thiothrix subterranea]
MLYEDPILEPLERNVWAIIKLHAMDGNSVTAFPTYEELMLRCQVGSKATISRALAILRATRWLTICKSKLRDGKGRVRGNIYALHDEPLQLAETLALDSDYLRVAGKYGVRPEQSPPTGQGFGFQTVAGLAKRDQGGR